MAEGLFRLRLGITLFSGVISFNMAEKRTFEITNQLGIHARVAAKLVDTANRFQAEITLAKDDVEVNGRGILDILTLYCPQGSRLTICAEGVDAEEAMDAFTRLIEGKFGET
jgi:phosphocarrier protein HPr